MVWVRSEVKKKNPTSGCGSLKWFAGGHGNTTEAGEDPGA